MRGRALLRAAAMSLLLEYAATNVTGHDPESRRIHPPSSNGGAGQHSHGRGRMRHHPDIRGTGTGRRPGPGP